MLVLISDFAVNEEAMETKYDELSAQISKLANLKSDLMSISEEQKRKSSGVADTSEVNEMLTARLSSKETILENQLSELASMQVMLIHWLMILQQKKSKYSKRYCKRRVEEVGGIPVDSEYVVFIVIHLAL